MKDILTYLIQGIVDNPDAAVVAEEDVDGVITFTVTCAKEDMGKVIGKGGKIIRSLRNLMKIPAMKAEKKIQIQLAE